MTGEGITKQPVLSLKNVRIVVELNAWQMQTKLKFPLALQHYA